jgi:hypothetical protein
MRSQAASGTVGPGASRTLLVGPLYRALLALRRAGRSAGVRPKQTYAIRADSDIASAISGISGVGANPSSAGARTA